MNTIASESMGKAKALASTARVHPVVLCGGGGSRLWPLSRQHLPKPFVPLIDGQSLLDLTLARLQGLGQPVLLVTGEEHRFQALHAAHRAGCQARVILEDRPRDTAVAMTLAALAAAQPHDLQLFCPADHFIPDVTAFLSTLAAAVPAAQTGAIVTMGVYPSSPSSAYGYIQLGEDRGDGSYSVQRFIEKPDQARAQQLLLGAGVLWNAGLFLCRADVLLKAVELHAPDTLARCRQAMDHGQHDGDWPFTRPDARPLSPCTPISFDKAVMERHTDTAVVPFKGQWSDVGSWDALSSLTPADAQGNRLQGPAIALHAQNTYVRAQSRQVVALGTRDLLVIETPDAVLVAEAGMAQQVREIEPLLAQTGDGVASLRVSRPWGWYTQLHRSEGCRIKQLCLEPGASLSLQSHRHRAEHWYVLSGVAQVWCGDDMSVLGENQSIFIGQTQRHRLSNPGHACLHIIEIQTGHYLEEDDIVRYEGTACMQNDASQQG